MHGLLLPLWDVPECRKDGQLLLDILARIQLKDEHGSSKVQEGLGNRYRERHGRQKIVPCPR